MSNPPMNASNRNRENALAELSVIRALIAELETLSTKYHECDNDDQREHVERSMQKKMEVIDVQVKRVNAEDPSVVEVATYRNVMAELHRAYGSGHLAGDRTSKAIAEYRQSIEFSDHPSARFSLALCYKTQGIETLNVDDLKTALNHIEAGIKLVANAENTAVHFRKLRAEIDTDMPNVLETQKRRVLAREKLKNSEHFDKKVSALKYGVGSVALFLFITSVGHPIFGLIAGGFLALVAYKRFNSS